MLRIHSASSNKYILHSASKLKSRKVAAAHNRTVLRSSFIVHTTKEAAFERVFVITRTLKEIVRTHNLESLFQDLEMVETILNDKQTTSLHGNSTQAIEYLKDLQDFSPEGIIEEEKNYYLNILNELKDILTVQLPKLDPPVNS